MSKLIQMTSGTFGWCPPGKTYVKPIGKGDGAVRVNDDVAERLVKAGVAVIVDDTAEKAVYPDDSTDESVEEKVPAVVEESSEDDIDLESLTVAQLRELANAHGIDLGDATRKADIIEVIREHL